LFEGGLEVNDDFLGENVGLLSSNAKVHDPNLRGLDRSRSSLKTSALALTVVPVAVIGIIVGVGPVGVIVRTGGIIGSGRIVGSG
jgi:hypothetical protein